MDFTNYLVKLPESLPEFDTDGYHNGCHVPFFKYQGCGNDFVMVDNTSGHFTEHRSNQRLIRDICQRRFGVGADGLVLLSHSNTCSFEMTYYNADGRVGTMCGNGSRCAVSFANYLGIISAPDELFDFSVDGVKHQGIYLGGKLHEVSIKMTDVSGIKKQDGDRYFVDTGSPHHVTLIHDLDLDKVDVRGRGEKVCHSEEYKSIGGTNASFARVNGGSREVSLRTYERGVYDETLACGTAAVAAAIVCEHVTGGGGEPDRTRQWTIQTRGGRLSVKLTMTEKDGQLSVTDLWLTGPTQPVYHGVYAWPAV